METPNNPIHQAYTDSVISELVLTSDYYQHKANECRDLVQGLWDWQNAPDSAFTFSVNGRSVASLKIGPGDNTFMQGILLSFVAFYQRKACEANVEIDRLAGGTNNISQVQGLS